MFSVNRLVGRTESRARDHGPEITPLVLPRLPPLPRSAPYALVPVGTRPARPAGTGTARQIQSRACLVKTQSTASDERRISHHASILEVRRSLRPRGVRTARRASRDEAGTGPARRGGRVAYGLVRTTNPRATTRARPPPESSGSGSTATLESRSCIMRDVHANPPRDISFSDACG
jgi:hypothetical protein